MARVLKEGGLRLAVIIEDGVNAVMYASLFAMALLAFAWQDPRTMEAHFGPP